MRANVAAFAAGAIFGIGLAVSGMTMPSKIVGFLDLFGEWDPSLAFVMAGAVAVHSVAYRLIRRRRAPLFDTKFHVPTRKDVSAGLVVGAALFGIGWGLGGYCPGPGIVSAAGGSPSALLFVFGMTLGMVGEHAAGRTIAGGARPTPPVPRSADADPQ